MVSEHGQLAFRICWFPLQSLQREAPPKEHLSHPKGTVQEKWDRFWKSHFSPANSGANLYTCLGQKTTFRHYAWARGIHPKHLCMCYTQVCCICYTQYVVNTQKWTHSHCLFLSLFTTASPWEGHCFQTEPRQSRFRLVSCKETSRPLTLAVIMMVFSPCDSSLCRDESEKRQKGDERRSFTVPRWWGQICITTSLPENLNYGKAFLRHL